MTHQCHCLTVCHMKHMDISCYTTYTMTVTISNDTPMSLSNSVSYDTHDRTCYTTYTMTVTISNDTPMSLSNCVI